MSKKMGMVARLMAAHTHTHTHTVSSVAAVGVLLLLVPVWGMRDTLRKGPIIPGT